MISFADALNQLQPILLVLGDRYEIFVAAVSAMIARIPIASSWWRGHWGLIDESIRHSITKMAHFHFVAAEDYRRRVIQLGEQPENVFHVGGMGIDNILRLELLNRSQLEEELDFTLQKRNLLVTFHPVTLEKSTSNDQMKELLIALEKLVDVGLIFTMPNADTDGRILFHQINEFCKIHPMARSYTSLGQLRYLLVKHVDGVIGTLQVDLRKCRALKKVH